MLEKHMKNLIITLFITLPFTAAASDAPVNLGFEEKLNNQAEKIGWRTLENIPISSAGWRVKTPENGEWFKLSSDKAFKGSNSVVLSRETVEKPRPDLFQCFNAKDFIGKKVELKGQVFNALETGYVSLQVEFVDKYNHRFWRSQNADAGKNAITGKTESALEAKVTSKNRWISQSITTGIVPAGADRICIGGGFFDLATGKAWIDDLSVTKL
jgi:hypothetical protein